MHKWSSNISNRHHKRYNIGLAFDCLVFNFSLVTLCDHPCALKPVLCFHMTSFNYGAKGVRDVEPTCRCHQSNIMPGSIFSVNITQCVTYG